MSFLDDLRSNKYSLRGLSERHGFNKTKASKLVCLLESRGYIEVKRQRIAYYSGQVGNLQNVYKVKI